MEELQEIKTGMIVRLRHVATGSYLKSLPINYSSGNSHQQVVVTSVDQGPENDWLIKHEHDLRDDCTEAIVINGKKVRLEHCDTGRNLHSHEGHSAPASPSQQEVTACGTSGFADTNDDWRVETSEEKLRVGSQFRLIHSRTNRALNSHGVLLAESGLAPGDYEVTASSGGDPNDLWVVNSIVVPEPMVATGQPYIQLELSSNGGSSTLGSWEELSKWWETEVVSYAWLTPLESRNTTAKTVLASLSEVSRSIAALKVDRPGRTKAAIEATKERIERLYREQKLRHSTTPIGQFVTALVKENAEVAVGALAYFVHEREALNSMGVAGVVKAAIFDQGLTGVDIHVGRLEKVHDSYQKSLGEAKGELNVVRKELSDAAAKQRQDVDRLIDKGSKSLATLESAYNEKLALEASVTYWKDKQSSHVKSARIWGAIFSGIVVGIGVGAFCLLKYWIGDPNAGTPSTQPYVPPYWKITLMLVFAALTVWALRILSRLLLTNIHLAIDAGHRAIVVLTYLSMLEKKTITDNAENRQLMLRTVFRPVSTGVVKDDGMPLTPLSLVSNPGGK
jgi:hypothetical protein